MLRLTIAPSGTAPPPVPSPDDADAEVWYDLDGTPCAYGHTTGAECWFHLPGTGSFRFGPQDPDVVAVAEPSASRHRVVDAYYRTVLPFALQVRGLEVLHASAVRAPHGVIALCARKETGKSTLAYALSRRGYPLWADDAVVFARAAGSIDALSVPFAIRLRPASAAFFGRARAETLLGVAAERDGAIPIELARGPLAAVCVLERTDSLGRSPVELEQLPLAAAFTSVLTHSYCFTLRDPERKQRMMTSYLSLAARVPVFRLRFGTGLDRLPAIMDAIEHAAGFAPAAA